MNSFTSDTDVEEKTDNALSSDIVGGMFGLDVMTDAPVAQPKFFGDEGSIFLANARSGINLLIRELNPAQVWFPSYLCNVMLGAVDQVAASIRFYEIDYDLKIQSREWIKGVLEGDLVIFILATYHFHKYGLKCNLTGWSSRKHRLIQSQPIRK